LSALLVAHGGLRAGQHSCPHGHVAAILAATPTAFLLIRAFLLS
jgi:hypothetical protein